jgi:hypothetical protein
MFFNIKNEFFIYMKTKNTNIQKWYNSLIVNKLNDIYEYTHNKYILSHLICCLTGG